MNHKQWMNEKIEVIKVIKVKKVRGNIFLTVEIIT